MRRNPERLAWLVLVLSFAICAVTASVVPPAARQFIDTRTTTRTARLDIISGTTLVRRAGTPGEQSATIGMQIEPGDQVRTAGDARAILWLFDDSNVELGPDSTVTLLDSQSTVFTDRASVIALGLAEGKPIVNVALPGTQERQFTVSTRFGSLQLDEGAYEVDLSQADSAEAVVRIGQAMVTAADQTVTCRTGQRVALKSGSPPVGPLPLSKDLLTNGNFALPTSAELPLGPGWKGDERNSEGNKGTVQVVDDAAGNYLRFQRVGQGHGENYAVQVLERDVTQFRSLKLRLEVKLVNQSLSGGGVAGSEYPFHIRVLYRDARGREGRLELGLYYQNDQGYPTTYGQKRPKGEWFLVERDLATLEPRPAQLIYIELAASGWDYESYTRKVELIAE
ncbi:MAG: FecR domain-containing protein [Chloroflexi bacterium]|nr:FecR domain-containing protein [Chloroflexota bacterium]MCL5107665.1 FecR domain-containing protein [Chloroflexota bacterium]